MLSKDASGPLVINFANSCYLWEMALMIANLNFVWVQRLLEVLKHITTNLALHNNTGQLHSLKIHYYRTVVVY